MKQLTRAETKKMDRKNAIFTYKTLAAERARLIVAENWQGTALVTDEKEYLTLSDLMADLAIDHALTEPDVH